MKIALILGLCVFSVVAHAEKPTAVRLSESELEARVLQSPKLYLPLLIQATEARLDAIYRARIDAAPVEQRESLGRSQDAWRKFIEAEMEYYSAEQAQNGGSPVYLLERHLYLLRQRIYQIQTPFEAGWPVIPKNEN